MSLNLFLPSKLIDYIGAGRPILGLTSPGAAASLISELGGWVADPADLESMKQAMKSFLLQLAQHRGRPHVWGKLEVRKRYEASVVADQFENILRELLA